MQLKYPPELPISAKKDEIIKAIRQNQVLVIAGETGSGKTTQIPKMCLEAGLGQKGMIGCTQPRRIAAVSVAERVTEETRDPKGVGYKIRFRDKTTADTRIKFMTDGVLLAETRSDKQLRRYDTIIIDEAHERSLNIDFLLGYLKTLLPARKDLKLIISSATLDTDKFSAHFDQAPIINVSGRTYPITLAYQQLPDNETAKDDQPSPVELAVRAAVELASDHADGDILIFMPTERDILDATDMLEKQLAGRAVVLPLFGRLQVADQRRIFRLARLRKIIVATNIAETSLTIPGIFFVIDTGLARIARYNTRSRTTSLQVSRISKASCDQRTGRCGRTGPGICLRLFSEEEYLARSEYTQPEIQRSNLAEVILQMISLGLGNPRDFPFIDPPSVNSVRDGYRLLHELGAITPTNQLTAHGRVMAGLPLDPCISRILIAASELNAVREVKIIAAGLSIQDPRIRPIDQKQKADEIHKRFADKKSDFMALLNIWNTYRETAGKVRSQNRLRKFCRTHFLSWQRMREWQDIVDQINDLTRKDKKFRDNTKEASPATIHQALLSGFLRNIGQKKEKNFYQISGGREAMVFPGSTLFNNGGPWIVCASFMETSRLFAMNTATIDVKWLEQIGADLCRRSWSDPHWEKKSGQVVALEKITLFGLVIVAGRRVNYGRLNDSAAREAREIFIRQALIPGELGGRYGFMQHNVSLIRALEDLEARVRRRDIVVDDETLYAFYDERLPLVYDRFTLNRLLKKKRKDTFLNMTEGDICLGAPETIELYRFPKTFSSTTCTLKLRYLFKPGHEADGVTADIPMVLAENIHPVSFEWLVPGMLEEKILNLLKYLPKTLRRPLVPLPDTVNLIMDSIQLNKGSLYEALERAVLKSHRVRIRRTDWQPDKLPVHLRMRFRLMREDNTVLLVTRSFQELLSYRAPDKTENQPAEKHTRQQPDTEIKDIRSWDFVSAPKPTPVADGKLSSAFLYPALYPDVPTGTVTLRSITDRQESLQQNRIGLRFLYIAQCRAEINALRRECKAAITAQSASWLSLGLSVPAAKLRNMLLDFLVDDFFRIEEGVLPAKQEFDDILATAKSKGINRTGLQMLTHLHSLLSRRREISTLLHNLNRKTGPADSISKEKNIEFQEHLNDLLPPDFLTAKRYRELEHTERYLKGLAVRMDRASHSPAKDSAKAEKIKAAANRLHQLESFETSSIKCCRALAEYKQMVEELKISIFAPELGTAVKVSEKRLQKKWEEVENLCYRVE